MSFRIRTEKGFTLLEVMIALAIVSIALVALLGLANRSLVLNERIQRLTHGTLLAQQKIAEIEAGVKTGVDEDTNKGTFEDPFSDYHWEILYEDTPLIDVEMVTVTVIWGDPERNEAVDMTSFLYH